MMTIRVRRTDNYPSLHQSYLYDNYTKRFYQTDFSWVSRNSNPPWCCNGQKKTALKPELVKEFVIAGDGNLEKTKQMLEGTPALLNASWDWGNG